MKKARKAIILVLCLLLLAFAAAFAACGDGTGSGNGGGGNNGGGGGNGENPGGNPGGDPVTPSGYTTVFEFEDLDFTDKSSSGLSGAAEGWELVSGIPGLERDQIAEANRPSNDHFAGYTYEAGFYYEFEVEAAAATTVDMVLRMNTEVGPLELSPDQGLEITVNGTAIDFNSVIVTAGTTTSGTFSLFSFNDYDMAEGVSLNQGTNTIRFTITEYVVSRGQAAPLFDCMKLTTEDDVKLTFANNYQEETGRGYDAD